MGVARTKFRKGGRGLRGKIWFLVPSVTVGKDNGVKNAIGNVCVASMCMQIMLNWSRLYNHHTRRITGTSLYSVLCIFLRTFLSMLCLTKCLISFLDHIHIPCTTSSFQNFQLN